MIARRRLGAAGETRPAVADGENSSPAPVDRSAARTSPGRPGGSGPLTERQETRPSRFTLCQRVLEEGNWPCELIDVEPLLDGRATVLHYLGPHQLDVASVRARFRVACDLEVVLEPAGTDLEADRIARTRSSGAATRPVADRAIVAPVAAAGAQSPEDRPGNTCRRVRYERFDPAPHAGCASCGISQLLAARGRKKDAEGPVELFGRFDKELRIRLIGYGVSPDGLPWDARDATSRVLQNPLPIHRSGVTRSPRPCTQQLVLTAMLAKVRNHVSLQPRRVRTLTLRRAIEPHFGRRRRADQILLTEPIMTR